jgi:tRNA-specific 2-thiouridylase
VDLLVLDLAAEFEVAVVRPFVEDYLRGRTPNPCAACNPRMKFGLLYDRAREHGAEALATGHYARLEPGPDGPALLRGLDPAKDQSYFLSLVPPAALARAMFPLGAWLKQDVAEGLLLRGLTPPLPAESQEACFVPDDDYRLFLQAAAGPMGLDLPGPGPIVDPEGHRLGTHRGLWRYTPGQRRGLGLAHAEPLYVLDKDAAANTLVVGPRPHLASTGCVAEQVNLLVPPDRWPDVVLVQTRYRQTAGPAAATFTSGEPGDGGRLRLDFAAPRTRPAPGQVAAVYDGAGRVLAGGIITEAA